MAPLKDVAKLAEVSTVTVSRILSGNLSFSVKEATRDKVLQTAEELEYKIKKSKIQGQSKL